MKVPKLGEEVAFQWEENCGLPGNTHKLDSKLAVKVGQLSVLLSVPSCLLVLFYCAYVCSFIWCSSWKMLLSILAEYLPFFHCFFVSFFFSIVARCISLLEVFK